MEHRWRSLSYKYQAKELPEGLDAFWHRGAGVVKKLSSSSRSYMRKAKKIIALESQYDKLSDLELKEIMLKIREKAVRDRMEEEDLFTAFALIREASFRTLGMRHYQVQLAGALSMYHGNIAEMATGEGKTLTATLAATVAAWRGRGCHVMTSNNYLAKRDALEMEPVYKFCGLIVDYIDDEKENDDRKAAYDADITYCTNKDVAADFLRDQLTLGNKKSLSANLLDKTHGDLDIPADKTLLRGLEFAIIDEADSVMIDDAVTPLLISGDGGLSPESEVFEKASEIADSLDEGTDYVVKERIRDIEILDPGEKIVRTITKQWGGIWKSDYRREELIIQALEARHFFKKDKQYIIDDGKIVIVDESTGRLMADRFWRNGMHQAVEAKERVEITSGKDTFARISFQKFFRFYKTVSGMTGTGSEAAKEFWRIYELPIVVIPQHRKNLRKYFRNRVFLNSDSRWKAVQKSIAEFHKKERPILVGTSSIKNSEKLSILLNEIELPHEVLNARRHKEEAEIVARAGKLEAVTVATNMAGRGTDIKLTKKVKAIGGLHVVATEKFISKRIDRQLYGRCSRQGDPGTVQCFLSLDDELVRKNAPIVGLMAKVLYFALPSFILSYVFSYAQWRAMTAAQHQRESILKSDNWLESSLGFAGKEH